MMVLTCRNGKWGAGPLEKGLLTAHSQSMDRPPITVIVAAVMIVVSMALLFRWHVVSSSIGVQRLDRWTGKIQFCSQANGKVVCVDESANTPSGAAGKAK
jgi:hypothetical protein